MRRLMIAASLAGALFTFPAAADEITDALAAAAEAYEAGDIATAMQQADTAAQLLAKKSAERLVAVFPEPGPGWTAGEVTAEGMTAAMMGGGIMAGRTYTDADGNTVTIDITGDSPMLMMLGAMLADPAMAASMGETATIGGQNAILTPEGDVQMMVANRFLIAISGSAPIEAKKTYGEMIAFDKLPD